MTPLEREIAGEIRRRGPLTFRRFMELALYHPRHGYYRRPGDPFGVRGDFYTNSQLQPVFGRLLAQQISQWYAEMGAPPDFTVVEMGAGRAETTAEIERCLPEARCIAVDVSSGQLPERFRGVVICNEFFDALPVHSLERRGDGLVEHFVGLAEHGLGEHGFAWVEGGLSDPQLRDYLDQFAPGLAEGQRIEANLAALDALQRIASSLAAGYLLTIDYGYTAGQIAAGRRFPRGSLMAYEKHQANEEVLADPGNRDLTAHVNFTALVHRGEDLGLTASPLRTQMRFLMELGEKDNFEAALGGDEAVDPPQPRLQLKTLLFGMGETFQVLVQRKRASR